MSFQILTKAHIKVIKKKQLYDSRYIPWPSYNLQNVYQIIIYFAERTKIVIQIRILHVTCTLNSTVIYN